MNRQTKAESFLFHQKRKYDYTINIFYFCPGRTCLYGLLHIQLTSMVIIRGTVRIVKKIERQESIYDLWADTLKQVTEPQKAAWIRDTLQYKENLHIFGRYFFPHIIKGDKDVPECHIDLIRELSNPKDSAIIFPRGFSKTTWEKIDTIHDIVYGLEKVILYIANVSQDAQNHFESIKQEFENNQTLRAVYGNLVPSDSEFSHKWTNKHFETTNGVNIVARGAGKGRGVNIKNSRPTKIIFDDVEDDEEVNSPERRLKMHNWIYNVIFPSRDKQKSKIKFIGTVISPMAEILAWYKQHGGIFRKAIENGQSIWPEMFSVADLEELKNKIGTRAFQQEYMNNPTDPSLAVIPIEWIEPHFYTELKNPGDLQIVIMFDPQSGEKKGSDYYGLSVVGRYRNDAHRYVLRVQTGKASQLDQAALIVRTYQEYGNKVIACGVEKVMTQVAVYQLILDWQAGKIELPNVNNTNRNISILAVEPEGKDKVARLQMHQPAFERGEIHLHSTMRNFAEKLSGFPAVDHDDDIDSLIYALEYANRSTSFIFSDSEENPKTTPVFSGIRGKVF